MTISKSDWTTLKGNKLTLKRKNSCKKYNSLAKRRLLTDDMLNGFKNSTQQHEEQDLLNHENNVDILKDSPVATLSNMGYTCYLNSVLYALRFTPFFLHNLHHLIGDSTLIYSKLCQTKAKTSSLGRNINSLNTGPSNRSTSSKDLLNLNNMDITQYKTKVQIVTDKLHELYVTMNNLEMKEASDPFQPSSLLQAIRDANAIFEGNHQQDAHELFLYLLDNLRETCDHLTQQVTHNPQLLNENLENNAGISTSTSSNSNNTKLWNYRRSWKWNYKSKKEKQTKEPINEEITHEEPPTTVDIVEKNQEKIEEQQKKSDSDTNNKKQCYNFVENFEGVTLCRTTCLECESITERKENFYDIPVPVKENGLETQLSTSSIETHYLNSPTGQIQTNPSDLFRLACVTTEKLSESNKYLCDTCNHYNEAIREVVFEKLPNIMVFQLKRFTTAQGGTPQKLNTFMPTPLDLKCFCEDCCKETEGKNSHHYELCCVIMHLGDTMHSGHYISFVRAQNYTSELLFCTRDHIIAKNPTLSASSSEKSLNILKFLKPRTLSSSSSFLERNGFTSTSKHNNQINGICSSMDCCGVRCNKTILENSVNQQHHDIWLECDDENIRAITCHELEQELSYKPNSTSTPYLLFYTKVND